MLPVRVSGLIILWKQGMSGSALLGCIYSNYGEKSPFFVDVNIRKDYVLNKNIYMYRRKTR
ncbi:MAG: hypothetical protein WD898_03070, partial [Candidatus Paceibacterota bacterium]